MAGEACESDPKRSQTLRVLQEVFGYQEFRPGQYEAVEAALQSRDVFVRLPTGSGKSLCYLLPPLMRRPAVSIVVSPLSALMREQVEKLSSLSQSIFARHFVTVADMKETTTTTGTDVCGYLFVSPQCAVSSQMLRFLKNCGLRRIVKFLAIDEAHCVSEWGTHFRTDYARIDVLRKSFPCSMMVLTATATSKVAKIIEERCGLRDPVYVTGPINRKNIFLGVVKAKKDHHSTMSPIIEQMKTESLTKTIIFVQTKAMATTLWELLRHYGKVAVHHSSLTLSTKELTERDFRNGDVSVVVATIGFGMGIDFKDVRLVIYYGIPSSLCQLYQMFGRAGRDGVQSTAIVICRNLSTRSKTVEQAVKSFLQSKDCIRKKLCEHLESSFDESEQMDYPCCTRCDYNAEKDFVDPNGFFSYSRGQRRQGTGLIRKRKLKSTEIDEKSADDLLQRLFRWRRSAAESQGFLFQGVEAIVSDSALHAIVAVSKAIGDDADLVSLWALRESHAKEILAIIKDWARSATAHCLLNDITNV